MRTALPPGPRAPRPVQAALWGLRFPDFTAAARRRFGATYTVRLGTTPAAVVTTDRDAIKHLLTGDPLRRASANDVLRPIIGDRSILLLEPRAHLARRKLLLPPFHGESVAAYREIVRALAREETAGWRPGQTVAVLPAAQRITLEVIMRAVLGMEDPALRARLRDLVDDLTGYPIAGTVRKLPGAVSRRAGEIGSARGALQMLGGTLTPAVMTFYPQFKRRHAANVLTRPFFVLLDRLYALVDEQIAQTRADPGLADRRDILALLVCAHDEDEAAMADEDLRDELVALLLAGHETTAAAIAWAAEHLAHDAGVRARAAEAAARGDDDPYLAALVKETLRIHPPLPIASGRILDESCRFGEHTVPAGTPILVDAYGLHREPDLYPDPERFDPQRFIDRTPEPYSWLPFGGGAHRCIGSSLAEMEIAVTVGEILRAVDFAAPRPDPALPVRRALTLFPERGGLIKVAGDAR